MATGYQFPAFPPGTSPNTVTGPGNPLGADAGVVTTIVFQVVISATATVNFEHTVDGTNWVAVVGKDMSSTSGALATSTTASGIFSIDASGSFAVRPNVTANTGSVTVTANKVLG